MALPQIDTPDYIKQRQKNDRLALLGQIADEPDSNNLNFYGYGPYGLISAGLNTLGTGLENINNIYEETGAVNNPMLGQSISGDSWQEVFNHNDLNEGIQNVRNQRYDYSNMLNNQNIDDLSNPNEYQNYIQYKQTGPWGAMLKDAGTFGPIGFISGFVRSAISDAQKKKNTRILNQQIDRANLWQINNRDNTIASNNQRDIRNNMRNYINNPIGSSFQDGGDLGNGVTMFNTGSTHQQNPYGGIPQGIASDGFPNMVEEGEVKYKDYIFSARLKPTKAELKDNVLPEKYAGLTFAKIAEKIQKESEDRPNDPVSTRTLDEMMGRLTNSQEEHKAKIEERRLAKALDNMPDEEKAALMASLMQQQSVPQNNLAALQGVQPQMPEQVPQEEQIQDMDLSQPMYANGGKIFIKPSKNSAHWGQEGLDLEPLVPEQDISPMLMWNSQEELKDYYRNAITDWFSKRNGYDANKLASYKLESRDEFNQFLKSLRGDYSNAKNVALAKLLESQIVPEGDLKETQEYIDWAKKNYPKNSLMWDAKIGIEHHPMWIKPEPLKGTTGQTKRYWRYNWNTGERTPITEAEYNNPTTGWKQNPELNEEDSQFLDYYIDDILPVAKDKTKPTENDVEPIEDTWLRYAPVLGGLTGLFNRPDYSYPNELSNWLGELQPIAAPSLGGYGRYNPYDVNLANNEAMAQLAAAQRANVAAGNRETQAAGLTALEDAYAKEAAARNLQWQQANEADRLTKDQYNLGIDQTKLGVIQNYDELNQDTRNRRVALGQEIAEARDASNTAYAAAQSANLTNLLENLGEIGKENWNRNERNRLLSVWPNIARMYGLT